MSLSSNLLYDVLLNIIWDSRTSIRRKREQWGLQGTRQQKHTFETIEPFVKEIKTRFPSMGARQLVTTLRQDYKLKVSEYVLSLLFSESVLRFTKLVRKMVLAYLNSTEREAVEFCKKKRFCRKRFWAAGVNDVWTCDQHDKWKRFGLWLHVGLDPYPGQLQWLKVWWSNRNPQLIGSYYLEAARKRKGMQTSFWNSPVMLMYINQVFRLSPKATAGGRCI